MLVISDNKKRTYLTRVAGLHLKIFVSIDLVRYKLDYSSIVTYLPILVSFGEWNAAEYTTVQCCTIINQHSVVIQHLVSDRLLSLT
jgi:hypothetical protein